jgi:predicted transcriptional regulator
MTSDRPANTRGSLDRVSRRERDVLHALLELGNRASAEEIRRAIADPPSYSAVRVLLSRLEQKGHVRHEEDGRRYLYSATMSPSSVRRTALRQFVRTFFRGSVAELMTALVRHEAWRDDELTALQREIERARKERSKP